MKRRVLVAGVAVVLVGVIAVILGWRGGGKGKGKGEGDPGAGMRALEGRSRKPVERGEERQGSGELELLVDDDREGTLRLEGIVIDAEEQPVAGAVVTVSTNPPRTTKSGEDGTFYFDKLVGRRYRLVATADEGVAGPVTARLTEKSDPVTLRLAPAAAVEVTVVDAAERKPVVGATVELRDLGTLGGTTGSDGKVVLRGVTAGRQTIVAWAPGYGKAYRDIGVARASSGAPVVERETIALRRGAPVSGIVKTKEGRPVDGAVVTFAGVSEWSSRADARRDGVKTDATGSFRFDAIPSGTFRFTARHAEYASGSSSQLTLDGTTEKSGVEIVLESGGTLAGRVVSKGGDPVGWAAVRVAQQARGFSFEEARQTLADEAGRFELTGLARKKLQVVALHESATSETIDVDLSATGEQRDLVLTLELDGVIAGIVVDSQGEPVPEAQVTAFPDMRGRGNRREMRFEWRLRGMAQERADAGGRWEIHGLREGDYRIRASRPGKEARGFLRDGTSAQVGDTDVKVVLEVEGGVKGKVLTVDGEPPEIFVVGFGGFGGFGGGGTPFSTSDGTFELDDVPPGERTLSVSGPSFDRVSIPVVIEADRVTDVGTISVSRGRTISGRVLDPSGAPVPGATVVAARRLLGDGSATASEGGLGPRGGGVRRATSDGDGGFTLYGVGTRDLVISAEHETLGRSTSLSIPGSTEPVVIDLVIQPFSSLEGVVMRGGKPVEEVPINVTSQRVPSTNFLVQSGPDGAFRFDRLAPDTYLVQATEGQNPLMGFRFHTVIVTLAPGETKTVELAIPEHTASLLVTPVAKGDAQLRVAEIRTVPGAITAKTYQAFELEAAALGAGDSAWQASLGGMPVEVENLAPGRYSVCAVPYPSELQGPQQIFAYREREGDNLPVFCVSKEVTAEPKQPVTIEVEVPAFVPDPNQPQEPVRPSRAG